MKHVIEIQSNNPAAESNGDVMEVHQNGSTGDSGATEDRSNKSGADGADFLPLHPLFACIEHLCLLLLMIVVVRHYSFPQNLEF